MPSRTCALTRPDRPPGGPFGSLVQIGGMKTTSARWLLALPTGALIPAQAAANAPGW